MCLAQGHNAVASRSRVKHSTTALPVISSTKSHKMAHIRRPMRFQYLSHCRSVITQTSLRSLARAIPSSIHMLGPIIRPVATLDMSVCGFIRCQPIFDIKYQTDFLTCVPANFIGFRLQGIFRG